MEYINGNDLYQMFNYGTYYIMKKRSYLNDINVFPVADGDTGNNLLQTLKTIVIESKKNNSFTKSLESISDSALVGARGNSGVIFAQFVNGLLKANKEYSKVNFDQFADLVTESYEHTYSSLSNPVEGTMLTIIKEFGSSMKELEDKEKSLKVLFSAVYQKMKTILQKTKTMMDVLTQNDVVDSGALGFVLFVEGIVSYYNEDNIEVTDYEEIEITDQHTFEGEITYQYCTEGLVSSDSLEEDVLRRELELLGDSIIIALGKSRFRVHIHTNTPELVFDILKKYGTIETQKIDNMKLEMTLKNTKNKRVLVTDSIADIDPKILEDNNVVVIPINIDVEGIPYLDKLSINNELLFANMDSYIEYPKTATPTIKYISDLFTSILLHFDEIIVITVSKYLSGTHNVIKNEADKLTKKGKNIIVFDSYNNSATEGLIVYNAIELFNKNVPTDEIIKVLEKQRENTRILVCLDTFKYATMSGRVPKIIGNIGMLFRIRPIMSLKNGKGAAFGMSLTKKGITKRIVKLVKTDMEKKGIDSYSLVHCLNEELAKEYEILFTGIIGKRPAYITEISSATAIHSGVGSVAIGYITK